MVFKILCFTLVACTLVQALPQGESTLDPFGFAHKVGDAAHETIVENSESINEKKAAVLEAGKATYDAAVDVAKSGVKTITTLPRVVLKMTGMAGTKNPDTPAPKSVIDNVQNAVNEVIDENAESKKKAVNSMTTVVNALSAAAAQSMATTWDIITSPYRFGTKVVTGNETKGNEGK